MRHEIKDKDSLFFALEVIIGGTPITGLSPAVTIYSLSNSKYWNVLAGPAAWQSGVVTNHMGEVDATNFPGLYGFNANSAYLDDSTSADQGYVLKITESTHNILEYVHVVLSDAMAVSTSPIVNANVVEYLGVTATSVVAGKPDVAVTNWKGTAVSATVAGIPDVNVIKWKAATVSLSTGSLPNINVKRYANNTAVSSVSGKPDVNVTNYLGTSASASVAGMPDVNVMDWNGSDTSGRHANVSASTTPETGAPGAGTGYPNIAVAAWQNDMASAQPDQPIYVRHLAGASGIGGESLPALTVGGWGGDNGVVLSAGAYSNLPEISVKAWNSDGAGASTDVFTRTALGDKSYGSSHTVELPAITVRGWGNDNGAVISVGNTHNFPRISVKTWEGTGTSVTGSNPTTPDDILVAWTEDFIPAADGGTPSVAVKRPNIRTEIIANNAIDEDAIQIDSVTYEEISDGAAEKISDAIWNADIFKTLYRPHIGGGTPKPAVDGSMAHAMIIQYLSQNMIHGGLDTHPGGVHSPVHTCAADNGDGKFYSQRLVQGSGNPLSSAEFISYIDRSVIIVKNFEFSEDITGMDPTSATWDGVQVYLGRITDIVTEGTKQYFQIKLVDEGESSPGTFTAGKDILIVKAETDSTMHEVAHEVWEEEVADHSTKHTFGMFNRIMAGLSQYNHRITDASYDESGRLLACRLVVYPSAKDAKDKQNALTTITVTSEYDEKQNMETFLAAEEGSDVEPD